MNKKSIIVVVVFIVLLGAFLVFVRLTMPMDSGEISITPAGRDYVANQDGMEIFTGEESFWLGTASHPQDSYLGVGFLLPEKLSLVKSAKVKFNASEDSWISTEFSIYAELDAHSRPFGQSFPISTRQKSLAVTKISEGSRWLKDNSYYYDVTAQVNEFLTTFPASSYLTLIFESDATAAWGRKFVKLEQKDGKRGIELILQK